MKKKRKLLVILALVLVLLLSACGKDEKEVQGVGTHHVEINIKDFGKITVELNGDVAPVTVENFMKLAEEGFYDGLTFHRIVSGFVIQGGDPLGTGMGGSKENIVGEFSDNGVENNLSHTRGAISKIGRAHV